MTRAKLERVQEALEKEVNTLMSMKSNLEGCPKLFHLSSWSARLLHLIRNMNFQIKFVIILVDF